MCSLSKKLAYLLAAFFLAASANMAYSMQHGADVQKVLQEAYDKYKDLQEGANADYIPALAEVDPNLFGIALITVDGKIYTVGDVTTQVSIQSISKVFTMARVIQDSGPEAISSNMGWMRPGRSSNSIVAVEQYQAAK